MIVADDTPTELQHITGMPIAYRHCRIVTSFLVLSPLFLSRLKWGGGGGASVFLCRPFGQKKKKESANLCWIFPTFFVRRNIGCIFFIFLLVERVFSENKIHGRSFRRFCLPFFFYILFKRSDLSLVGRKTICHHPQRWRVGGCLFKYRTERERERGKEIWIY